MSEILLICSLVIIVILSAVLHEIGHAYTADRLGDPTPRIYKRLSLNPLVHLHPIGSFLLPLVLILMKANIVFAFARPVPINPYNLPNPLKDTIKVAIAGPFVNIVLSLIFAGICRILLLFNVFEFIKPLFVFLFLIVLINLILAFFNLLPIPPLDGGKVLLGFLPERYSFYLLRLEPYWSFIGFAIIILLLYIGILRAIWFFAETVTSILTGLSVQLL